MEKRDDIVGRYEYVVSINGNELGLYLHMICMQLIEKDCERYEKKKEEKRKKEKEKEKEIYSIHVYNIIQVPWY